MIKPFRGDYKLTQGFGENPDWYKKWGLKGHNGLDYVLPNGTEVIAPHNGIIREIGRDDNGYGRYVKIEEEKNGSVLAHLQKIVVQLEQKVREGELVAYSDNTGWSTGPHLHWGWYKGSLRDRTNGYNGFENQIDLMEADMFLGKPKEYWQQVEKDREDLMKQVGEYDKSLTACQETAKELEKKIKELEQAKEVKSMVKLEGKKTYIVAGLMAIIALLYYLGYLDENVFKALEGILLGGGLAALRQGVARLEK